ncbi:hypothetical protein [Flavivirga spongiicola]|uniref:Alpha-galactosidase n=2 Tax=Flavivirga spongiicola TaxID=421621 RepID=A0ABU7XXN3_9FLAO|nr:hypothetical protein [Flavivirga sp. MEBiC05379]MDO5980190.1 hypothetical protein [Flavivirga sp. MEBiC05379]
MIVILTVILIINAQAQEMYNNEKSSLVASEERILVEQLELDTNRITDNILPIILENAHFDRNSLITFGKRYTTAYKTLNKNDEPKPSNKPDWLLDGTSYKANVYKGKRSDEIIMSNGLLRRVFRIKPNAATVRLDNLVTGESLLRGVKPEAIVKINGINYEIGGLKGQPNYAFLKEEWLDGMTSDASAMKFVGFKISKPKKPFGWKRFGAHNTDAEWPPKGVHLQMDYALPSDEDLIKGTSILPSSYGRQQLYKTNFNTLDDGWRTHYSSSHERSSFENEGKIGEIYTPQNTTVYVERVLNADTRIIEATFNAGTDKTKDYGPGIALVWPDKTLKFYLRPGPNIEGIPTFGLWDGKRHNYAVGGQKPFDINQPWTLRLRIADDGVYCEAKSKDGEWRTLQKLPTFKTMPSEVRIGKTNAKGIGEDLKESQGELARLQVMDFSLYGVLKSNNKSALKSGDLTVSVHYELYDGIPVMGKWLTLKNNSDKEITVDKFTSEIIAAIEYTSTVNIDGMPDAYPNIHVETDYAFASMNVEGANRHVVKWLTDPDYATQVNYLRVTPCLLNVGPELGPDRKVKPNETFKTFRTFVLPHDSFDRERQGLSIRKMYRTLAPWTTENPLMMHARFSDWDRVKLAIDQASEVGFEMVILTFGSSFNMEDDSPEYLVKMKKYADYAKSKGIEIGGYSLLASRKVGGGNDVVMPPGRRPNFGNSPCLESSWGQDYFRKLYNFYKQTGFKLLEHDGSYPGDICASTEHPGHNGLEDSRWKQYEKISKFYQWCREQGIVLNIPDYYYLAGGNKCGMGYREVNWSLPRNQQLIHARQNIYDGTWQKMPSMGWMFVPLTEYHGGGAAATIEPLNEHLDHYESMMVSTLGAGVQAFYRGPRLYDTNKTKTMVTNVVNWFKEHREVLEGDIIHLRRPDGQDLDYWLSVNPQSKEKGMLMVYNPLKEAVVKKIKVPLYYTGLKDRTVIKSKEGLLKTYTLNRDYSIEIEVKVPANSYTWYVME